MLYIVLWKKTTHDGQLKHSVLFERADNACQLCGTNKRQLHIHHIDKNPSNNSKNNLIVVLY